MTSTCRIAVLTDTLAWQDRCREVLKYLHYDVSVLEIDRSMDVSSDDVDLLLLILPGFEHPIMVNIEAFKADHPDIPILAFFPPEELRPEYWSRLKLLDSVAALPLEPFKIQEAMERVRDRNNVCRKLKQMGMELAHLISARQVFVTSGRYMTSSLEVDKVLTGIMDAVGSLLKSEAWSVALRDMQTGDLVFRAAQGGVAEQVKGLRIPRGKGIIGWVCENAEPLIVPDTSKDHRHFKAVDRSSGFRSHSILCMPLKTKENNLGAIEFINKVGSQFASQDMDRVRVILDLAAIALENAIMFEKLSAISERDELTGLYNQRTLVKRLERCIETAKQQQSVFGYIFLDLDHLKLVNDRFGHLRGRAVIKEVGSLLQSILKPDAIVGRYGGDEFWVILPGADKPDTMDIAENIRKAIESHVFLKDQGLGLRLTASLGVVVFPSHADSFDKMAQLADEALFMAKKQNRNKVICALDTIQQ
ncbi:MAG: sensor domain-containing diguanylate cyclase [bacterium]